MLSMYFSWVDFFWDPHFVWSKKISRWPSFPVRKLGPSKQNIVSILRSHWDIWTFSQPFVDQSGWHCISRRQRGVYTGMQNFNKFTSEKEIPWLFLCHFPWFFVKKSMQNDAKFGSFSSIYVAALWKWDFLIMFNLAEILHASVCTHLPPIKMFHPLWSTIIVLFGTSLRTWKLGHRKIFLLHTIWGFWKKINPWGIKWQIIRNFTQLESQISSSFGQKWTNRNCGD